MVSWKIIFKFAIWYLQLYKTDNALTECPCDLSIKMQLIHVDLNGNGNHYLITTYL